ncbi:MAG: hypothetical protein ACK52I_22035 [Pseudomonadota bacterium]
MPDTARTTAFPEIRADARLAPRRSPRAADEPADAPGPGEPSVDPRRSRAGRELRYLGLVLGASLLLMPLLVYLAGALTLGPYEDGLAGFLATLYGDFVRLVPAAWALLVGPYLLFWALRLTTRPWRRRPRTA